MALAAELAVDLNADVGEGYGRWNCGPDAEMLRVVSSANIACGYHAGDPSIMRACTEFAASQTVSIGAHVAYPDRAGFGRRFLDMSATELTDAVIYQIAALDGFARLAGSRVTYVKPHGALYHSVLEHIAQAEAVAGAIAEYDSGLTVLGPPRSAMRDAASRIGLPVAIESFPDRSYTPDGQLVSRQHEGAVISDPRRVAERAVRMVTAREVEAVDGTIINVAPDSLCIHGDAPGADTIARCIQSALSDAGVAIKTFSR
jgi:5-oxoprolinase (ATP-hydrolysing) subunit A